MKKHIVSLSIIFINILLWGFSYPYLSNHIPIHWSFSGEVDRYATKTEAMLLMLGLLIFVYAVMILAPKLEPRKKNLALFSKTYHIIVNAMLLLFSLLNLLLVLTGLGYHVPMGSFVPVLVGAILIVIGNYLPRVRSNFFIGIKNPWTLSSDTVWKKTHRFASKMFTIAGILIAINSLLPIGNNGNIAMLALILIAVFAPYVYSYVLYRQEMGFHKK
ncbi:SdpI family protein [Bacillus sp. CLL-7-23]|uniref:Immunity protein SdpI n=1 Tax=Bacillus changyiensis TaxID=3004103 RepID=A0ABT4X4Q9_9BACI|nr:SdpI family protein [Bacillus changyiensis]MDA7026729.1 SdpI family protein [Bacillus changyiensis]